MNNIEELKKRLLHDIGDMKNMRALHDTIKDGLIGSLKQEYLMRHIDEDRKTGENTLNNFDKTLTPVFHAMVDMMTANLVHFAAFNIIKLVLDTPTFKSLVDKALRKG